MSISYHNCHYLHSRFLSRDIISEKPSIGTVGGETFEKRSEMKHYNLLLIIFFLLHWIFSLCLSLTWCCCPYSWVSTKYHKGISIAIFFMFHLMLKLNFTTWSIHLPLIIINLKVLSFVCFTSCCINRENDLM